MRPLNCELMISIKTILEFFFYLFSFGKLMMADGKNVNFVFTLSDDDGQYIFYEQ